jgi:integrase
MAVFPRILAKVLDTEIAAMARTLRDAKLETRAARERLRPRGKPYWRELELGCHLGYRRLSGKAGRWCVRHYAGQQTYQTETIATADDFSDADGTAILNYRQAQAAARKRMVERAHTTTGRRGPMTVADALEAYVRHQDDNGKPTADARYRIDALILPQLGNIEVPALTTEKVRNWLTATAEAPPRRGARSDPSEEGRRRRRASANRIFTILRAALNFAWREGFVPSDAAWRKVRPFKGVDGARLRYLSVDECRRLVNACEPDFRALVVAALQTGARYSEIARLQVPDFNPDSGTLHIRRSKSGKERQIVLTAEGVAFFRRRCVGLAGSALMFTRRNGEPWGRANQGDPMREACARAKIQPRIGFHGLRHSWASLAVMAGMPLMIVARNLGHRDTRMCEKHYAHLSQSYEADAVRKLAPKFGFKPDTKVTTLGGR